MANSSQVYLSEKLREKINTLSSILVHELSHVHIRQYSGTFKYITDVPGWFLEGVAVYVSSGGGAETVTAEQAEAAIRNATRFEPDDSGRIIGHKTAHSYSLEPHMYYRQAGLFVESLTASKPRLLSPRPPSRTSAPQQPSKQERLMPKGYWIVHVDVTDPGQFKAYAAAASEALKKHGARFLVRAGRFENPEGASRMRNTIVEFPSYQAALECWKSREYQDAIKLRAPVSTMDLVIIEGYDGPQPC